MAKSSRPPPDEQDPRKIEVYLQVARLGFNPQRPSPKKPQQRGYRDQLIAWLESQRNLFGQALNSVGNPLMVTDHQGEITFANEAARDLFTSAHQLEGQSITPWVPESVAAHLKVLASGFVHDRTPLTIEVTHLDKNAHERVFMLSVIPGLKDHVLVRCVFSFEDITEQHRLERQIKELQAENHRLKTINPFTGLLNRAAFRAAVETELARAKKEGVGLLTIFIDANRLKEVNDTIGHRSGDELLKQIARHLERSLKAYTKAIAHPHGDEFSACLQARSEDAARQTLERLVADLSFSFELEGETVHSTSAIGGIFVKKVTDDLSVSELFEQADKAMYKAKKQGKSNGSSESASHLDVR